MMTLQERAEAIVATKMVELHRRWSWDQQTVTIKVMVGYGEPEFFYHGMPITHEEMKNLSLEEGWSLQYRQGRPLYLSAEGHTEKEARERVTEMVARYLEGRAA